MKTFCLIILSGLYLFPAAAQLNEDFTDGNFTSSPPWEGDTQAWKVDELQRLNTKDTSVSQLVHLSTPASNSKNAKWEFLLQMNFNPSASNRIRIYLFSDRPTLKGPLNGYFLQVGESGSEDGYDLYRQDSTAVTRVIEGPGIKRSSGDTLRARFRITRDQWGNWELLADSKGDEQFVSYGKAWDNTYAPDENYFGLLAKYTATRSGKFFFDDLRISPFKPDPSVPPPFIPGRGTIIITEIFADPSPANSLPENEFFELYNTSDTVIYLRNWTWKDEQTASGFENDSIAPGEYLLVCHRENTAAFSEYGHVAGIYPFPSLNNSGDRLKLISPYALTVDSLDYSNDWYRSPEKKNGGWSLERIAFSIPCFPEANWAASVDPGGGTPGKANSLSGIVRAAFRIRDLKIKDSLHLEIAFNTFPETASALEPGNYVLNNGAAVQTVQFREDKRAVILNLGNALRRGTLYRLDLQNLRDCYGNLLENGQGKEFRLPQLARAGDVVINEILFNPRQGGADFVEIYNRSDKILDLFDLQLASALANDSLEGISALADSTVLFYPGEYRLLSKQPEKVKEQYFTQNPDAFLKMEKFPVFNNKSGNCVLLSKGLQIDRFNYAEAMHFELIVNPEGVSLEKIHFDLPAGQPGVFCSASSTAGYATPGYQNSQFSAAADDLKQITLSNQLFSPDNDGFNDLLQINYRFRENNLVASVRIFDINGYLVKNLANNRLLGTSGTFTWDGTGKSGNDLRVGMYLVCMEFFSGKGWSGSYKKACVLARKE